MARSKDSAKVLKGSQEVFLPVGPTKLQPAAEQAVRQIFALRDEVRELNGRLRYSQSQLKDGLKPKD